MGQNTTHTFKWSLNKQPNVTTQCDGGGIGHMRRYDRLQNYFALTQQILNGKACSLSCISHKANFSGDINS